MFTSPNTIGNSVRYFPSAARQRLTAASVGLVALAALAIPLAHAGEDDLEQRKKDVEGRIDDAADDLQEASRDATRASRSFEDAQADLDSARAALVDVRARLVAARERDAELKVELAQAEADLELADAALAAGELAVEEQREVVRATVISMYTDGDPQLRAVGSLLETSSIEDISDQRLGSQVVSGAQTSEFEYLEEIEADLVDEQADVERTTAAVEAKRLEAADNLVAIQDLYAEANVAKQQVEGYVTVARTARQQAYAARARDRQILQALKAREAKIQERLLELARRQRNQTGFTGDSGAFLEYPVDGPVTSPYGFRTHPIYGYYSLHNGTDFGAGCGSALYASAGGTVIDTYYDSVYGNRLFLSVGNVNGKNLVLIYNHMAGYQASEGERVERGETVGSVGSTGWSTGCHLHFTVMADGVAVDPATYL